MATYKRIDVDKRMRSDAFPLVDNPLDIQNGPPDCVDKDWSGPSLEGMGVEPVSVEIKSLAPLPLCDFLAKL